MYNTVGIAMQELGPWVSTATIWPTRVAGGKNGIAIGAPCAAHPRAQRSSLLAVEETPGGTAVSEHAHGAS